MSSFLLNPYWYTVAPTTTTSTTTTTTTAGGTTTSTTTTTTTAAPGTGIQYIASTSSTGTSINISGLGLLENDLVIVLSTSDGTTQNLPTGYTAGQNGTGGSPNYRWSYKRMGPTPDTTVAGLSGTSVHIAAVFRNVDPTTPLNVTSPTVSVGGSGMPNPPAITTVSDGCMIVALGFLDDDVVASTVAAPSGYTLGLAAQYGTAGSGATEMFAYLLQTSAGAADPGAFTATGGDDGWVGATIALNPIGGAGPTTTTSTTTTTTTIAPRTYYEAAYVAARSTRASTAYINIANMNAAGAANTRTAIFWMGNADNNATDTDVRMRLTGSNSTAVIQLNNLEPQDTTDRMSVGGMFPYSSSTAVTWSIQESGEDSGDTQGYSGYAMAGLLLHPSDAYNSASAALNTISTTYATYTSVTVPAGNYIIVGSAAIGSNNTAGNPRFRIFDGTNTYGELLDVYLQDTTNRSAYWHVFRRNVAGSTTFSLQYRGDGANQGIMLQGAILALDTTKFRNVYYAENTGSVSTTSTTMVNALSATFNIANPSNKHILLASAMLSGSSTASSFACKLRNTTTATDYTVEHFREPNATSEELPTVVARTVTFSGASNTIAWQFDVETGGTTGHLKNMMIVLLDTGTT